MDRLLRVDEVCSRLTLGRTRVYELIQSGELPSLRVGAARRVPAAALEQFITDRMEGKDWPRTVRSEEDGSVSGNQNSRQGPRT